MLVLFHITLEIPLLTFTHSARAQNVPFSNDSTRTMCPFSECPPAPFSGCGKPYYHWATALPSEIGPDFTNTLLTEKHSNNSCLNNRFETITSFVWTAKPSGCLWMAFSWASLKNHSTVMILSFRTDMPGQTVQTQIRLLLEEQSDQGLHCLPFCLHRLDSLLYGRATYM